MDNNIIHQGLDKSSIRDYLGKQLRCGGFNVYDGCGITRLEDDLKNLLDREEKILLEINQMKTALVLKKLIANQGWKEFDISNYVNYSTETYFPFLGTEKEFEELIENRKDE